MRKHIRCIFNVLVSHHYVFSRRQLDLLQPLKIIAELFGNALALSGFGQKVFGNSVQKLIEVEISKGLALAIRVGIDLFFQPKCSDDTKRCLVNALGVVEVRGDHAPAFVLQDHQQLAAQRARDGAGVEHGAH